MPSKQEKLRERLLDEVLVHDEDCAASLYDQECNCIQQKVVNNLLSIITKACDKRVWKERLSLLEALQVLYACRDKEPFGDFGDNLNELIKETKATLKSQED